MTDGQLTIAAVIVTYGDRSQLLRQVVRGLDAMDHAPDVVVVVNNAASVPPETFCSSSSGRWITQCVDMGMNSGSAAGYAAGIERALALNADLIWLLDDDNVPSIDCLKRLVSTWVDQPNRDQTAVAALRPDRKKYVQAAFGHPSMKLNPRNSFLGFSITNVPRRFVMGRGAQTMGSAMLMRRQVIEYAVYGGLMLPASLVRRIGLPSVNYFLYIDDREYTTRITLGGGSIVLESEALVTDIDSSWGGGDGERYPIAINPFGSNFKTFYTIRNAIYYEKKYVVKELPVYILNALIYLTGMLVLALRCRLGLRFIYGRARLVLHAISDGWHGRLGQKPGQF